MGRIIRDKNTGLIYRYGDKVVEYNTLRFNCAADSSTSLIDCGFSIRGPGGANTGPIFDTPFVNGWFQNYMPCVSSGQLSYHSGMLDLSEVINSENDWSLSIPTEYDDVGLNGTNSYCEILRLVFDYTGGQFSLALVGVDYNNPINTNPLDSYRKASWRLLTYGTPNSGNLLSPMIDVSTSQIWNNSALGITIAQKNKKIYISSLPDGKGLVYGRGNLQGYNAGEIILTPYTYSFWGMYLIKSSYDSYCSSPYVKMRGPIKIWNECIIPI